MPPLCFHRLFACAFAAVVFSVALGSCTGGPATVSPAPEADEARTVHAELIEECFNTLQGTWRDHHWPFHVVVFRDSVVYEYDTAGNLSSSKFVVADGVLRHRTTGHNRIFQYLVRHDTKCYRYRVDYMDSDSMTLRTTCTWNYCCNPEEEGILRVLTRVRNGRE